MKYVSKDYGLIDFESWYYPYPSSSRLWVDTLLDLGMCQTKEMLEYIDELETYNKECNEEPRGLPW